MEKRIYGYRSGIGRYEYLLEEAKKAVDTLYGIEESAAPLVESLDAYLWVVPPKPAKENVWSMNVTHNNAKICSAVDPQLYKLLWNSPPTPVSRLMPTLKAAIAKMEGNMEKYRKLDPPNGWGGADDLLLFLKGLHFACTKNPTATYEAHG